MYKRLIQLLLLLVAISLYGQRNFYPLPEVYHTYPEMIEEVKQVCREYPKLAKWEIIGHSSYSQKPIYAVRVSNLAQVNFESRPSLLIHGSSQGEEVIGIELSLRLLQDVVSSYGNSPEITKLLDTFELWFIPTMNPEGFDTVSSGEFFLCRKNKSDTNFNGLLEIDTDGVDLNKNFDFNWIDFAKPHPESIYFKGHCPASETEVLAMQDFFHRENLTYALNYHSSATGAFSEIIFFPWNDGSDISPDYQHYLELGEALTDYLPKDYLPGNYQLHLGTTTMIGYLRHYLYAKTRTLAYDIEIGGNTEEEYSVIRPGEEQLHKILNKHTLAFRSFARRIIDNTSSVRIVDYDNRPQANTMACWDDYQSTYFDDLKSNKAGYLFRYLPEESTPLTIKGRYPFVIVSGSSDIQVCKIPFDDKAKLQLPKVTTTDFKSYTYCSDVSRLNTFPVYTDTSIRTNFNGTDFGVSILRADTLSIHTANYSCDLEISLYNRNKKFLRKTYVKRSDIDGVLNLPLKVSVKEKAYIVIENKSSETFFINMEKYSSSTESSLEVRFQSWEPTVENDLALELK